MDLDRVLEQATQWAREAGRLQLEHLGAGHLRIERKSSDYDLVMEVDKLCEAYLVGQIRKEYPDHSVLSEENGEDGRESAYRWVIDPIDGTTNYVHAYPIFGVSIALQSGGRSILGVVYFPVLGQLFQALRGRGSYQDGRRLTVSETAQLSRALLATGFPYDKATSAQNNLDFFNRLVPRISGIRRSGSAAFDLCSVAAGHLDGFWELKIKPWDMAAAGLILEEAGGTIVDLPGYEPISLAAGNPRICQLILDEIAVVDGMKPAPARRN
jgi:myo-inositol-1(or 4)-monophosphatase